MVSLVYPEHLLRGRREHQVLLAALPCQGCEQHCEASRECSWGGTEQMWLPSLGTVAWQH